MIRTLIFLALLMAAAFGLGWLLEKPGELTLVWLGYHIETSPLIGVGVMLLCAIVLSALWGLIRFIFKIPSLVSLAASARRRARGFEALSRGIIAAGAGDALQAKKAALEVKKHIPHEPLGLLLDAQTAQLAGDRGGAEHVFHAMAERPETRLLGLRGLHAEALRKGDAEAAHQLALQAHRIAPLGWSGQAVLERHAAKADWELAKLSVEQNLRAKIIDKATAERQFAVLDAADALDREMTDPASALKLARAAIKRAPDLVPAVALAGRLLSRKGDMKGGSKIIEQAYSNHPHPDLAQAYIDMRPGNSSADRLTRARKLARLAPDHPESRMMLAKAALSARDFGAAREAMAPLIAPGQRPTGRMCLIMAEIEDLENGAQGLVREWLARGARAPRGPAWMADGVVADVWAPVSPATGKLDAFRWSQDAEQISGPIEETLAARSLDREIEKPAPDLALSAPLEARAEEGAAPAARADAEPAKPPATPQPVIFPLAAAPDDPGPRSP